MTGAAVTHPRLGTSPTTLRRFELADAPSFAALHRDPLNVKWTGSQRNMDTVRAAGYIAGNLAAGWDSGEHPRFAVVEKLAGGPQVVGTVSLQEVFSTKNGAHAGGSAALGIKMLPQGRGTGSAARAVELLCGWAFETLGLGYLHWRSATENSAGLALARRCGFSAGAPIPGYGHVDNRVCDGVILTLSAEQWAKRIQALEAAHGGLPALGESSAPRELAAQAPVPELRADAVVLRALTMDDAATLVECCQDAQSIRWTTIPLDYTLDRAQSFIRELVPQGWQSQKVLTFGVADPATNVLLGTVDLQRKIPGSAAVGINIAPGARGKGVAEAAVRLLLDYAFGQLDLRYVHWHAAVPNWESRKLAWKLGFAFDGELRGSYNDRGTPQDEWVLSLAAHEPRTPQRPWDGPAPVTR